MFASFGDRVRIRVSSETESAGLAGLAGQVYGETVPSSSGVDVIGSSSRDYAVNVHVEALGRAYWLAPELVEFLDHAEGMEIRLEGIPHKWIRSKDGRWSKESAPVSKRPWWKFW